MKKLFTFLVVISITFGVFAQSPEKMSYQCVVRNTSGGLVTNQSVGIRISILQGTPTGTVVYQETYNPNPQTNANGLISIEIGDGVAMTGTFSAINWASGPYFLKTETDPTGGTNYTISGTSQLLSVPYAMHAKTAENGFSGNYYDLTNKPLLFSGNYDDLTSKPVLFNGTWATITGKPTTLAGYGITDGISTSHVANGITSTMIGNWNTAFIWGNHAGLYRPISYVPAWSEITAKPTTITGYGITDAVTTSGDQTIGGNKTFTGTIDASFHRIIHVGLPENSADAVPRDYIDNLNINGLREKISLLENTLKAGGLVRDYDGNPYNIVVIGTQIWMAEDLKTMKYSDGTPIPIANSLYDWSTTTSPGYCSGAFYNWWAINNMKLCPTGWHVSSDTEWKTLEMYLGMSQKQADSTGWRGTNQGTQLKSTGGWVNNGSGTNTSGFTARNRDYRRPDGSYSYEGDIGNWWCTSSDTVCYRALNYVKSNVYRNIDGNKNRGCSVRCVKNN